MFAVPGPARALQLGDGFFTKYLWLSHTQLVDQDSSRSISSDTKDIFGHVLMEEKEPEKLIQAFQKQRKEGDPLFLPWKVLVHVQDYPLPRGTHCPLESSMHCHKAQRSSGAQQLLSSTLTCFHHGQASDSSFPKQALCMRLTGKILTRACT